VRGLCEASEASAEVRRRYLPQGAVIAVVAMIERTAVHPWHITPVHRRQLVPQFLVEQHAAVASAAAHPIAQLYWVDMRHGCWQVIDPSFRRGVSFRAKYA
jgi:hypothetical protein